MAGYWLGESSVRVQQVQQATLNNSKIGDVDSGEEPY